MVIVSEIPAKILLICNDQQALLVSCVLGWNLLSLIVFTLQTMLDEADRLMNDVKARLRHTAALWLDSICCRTSPSSTLLINHLSSWLGLLDILHAIPVNRLRIGLDITSSDICFVRFGWRIPYYSLLLAWKKSRAQFAIFLTLKIFRCTCSDNVWKLCCKVPNKLYICAAEGNLHCLWDFWANVYSVSVNIVKTLFLLSVVWVALDSVAGILWWLCIFDDELALHIADKSVIIHFTTVI